MKGDIEDRASLAVAMMKKNGRCGEMSIVYADYPFLTEKTVKDIKVCTRTARHSGECFMESVRTTIPFDSWRPSDHA